MDVVPAPEAAAASGACVGDAPSIESAVSGTRDEKKRCTSRKRRLIVEGEDKRAEVLLCLWAVSCEEESLGWLLLSVIAYWEPGGRQNFVALHHCWRAIE